MKNQQRILRFLLASALFALIAGDVLAQARGVALASATSSATQATQQPDYARFIPADTQMVAIVRPAERIFNHPLYKQSASEHKDIVDDAMKSFESTFGDSMEHCTVLVSAQLPPDQPGNFGHPRYSFAFAVFDRPIARLKQLQANGLAEGWEEVKLPAGSYWKESPQEDRVLGFLNEPEYTDVIAYPADSICVVARESSIGQILAGEDNADWSKRIAAIPAERPITAFISQSALEQFAGVMSEAPLPPGIAILLPMLDKVEFVTLGVDVSDQQLASVTLETASEADAKEILSGVKQTVQMAKAMLTITNSEPFQDVVSLGTDVLEGTTVATESNKVSVKIATPDDFADRFTGPLLDAVAAARVAARRTTRSDSLHQIGLAVHMYHDVHDAFPPGDTPNARDANGRPLLSWRVYLLPYLEQQELFEKFHLDEPWDSEHNKPLLAEMPDIYALNEGLPPGMTEVIAPYGKNTILGDSKTTRISSISDGTTSAAMIFEAAPEFAVPWTKPDDFQFDPNARDAMERFGNPELDIFAVVMAYGAVMNLPKSTPAEVIGWMIDIKDRKPEPGFDYRQR